MIKQIIGSKDPSLSSNEMVSGKVKTKKSDKKGIISSIVVCLIIIFCCYLDLSIMNHSFIIFVSQTNDFKGMARLC